MKIDGTSMEKTNVSGDFSSGSMEDLDLDNENSQSTSIIVGLCTDMCPGIHLNIIDKHFSSGV